MALEWLVIGTVAGAEAIMLILLTLPGLNGLRQILTSAIRSALRPMLAVIPFCLFLLMDIYWKFETMTSCASGSQACTPSEKMRFQKSVMKSERNILLIVATLMLYWLLVCVTKLVTRLDELGRRVNILNKVDDHKD